MTTTMADYRRRQMARIETRCRQMGLGRDDRLEIAANLLDRASIESFTELSPVELARLVDGFETAYYSMHLLMERQRGLRR